MPETPKKPDLGSLRKKAEEFGIDPDKMLDDISATTDERPLTPDLDQKKQDETNEILEEYLKNGGVDPDKELPPNETPN